MKLDRKGHTFIDVVVAMVIFMVALTMMIQFLGFLKRNKQIQDINIIVLQSMQNESERAYRSESWGNLPGKTYSVPEGSLEIIFSDHQITIYNTESIKMTAQIPSMNDFSQEVILERSVYWNE